MDAFYASVEQRDDPALRGKPVAVGGSRARGVVAAASYEARAFGVRSAMPSATAIRRCPDLVFVRPRFDVYSSVSRQIRAIFASYTPHVEPLSLDEAYLDVTDDIRGLGSASAIATEIRARIAADTGLTASAGVSYNKFVAKLASDQNKPDGLCVIPPERGAAFVASLPVKRFHGVGPVTAAKMASLGIETGADLRDRSLTWLQAHFGSYAEYLFRAARGGGRSPGAGQPPGQVGRCRTDVRDQPRDGRGSARRAGPRDRGGVGTDRARGHRGADDHAEAAPSRFPDHHSAPNRWRCRPGTAACSPRRGIRCSMRNYRCPAGSGCWG